METLDWIDLSRSMNKNNEKIPYDSNKHLFTKIAFDVFKLNNVPTESLWKLEEIDGKQFLVAMYDDEDNKNDKITVQSGWNALSDKSSKNITLFYKDIPIQRFASSEYGFSNEDIHIFQNTLIEKLSSDQAFRQKFLDSQTEEFRAKLFSKFPELA